MSLKYPQIPRDSVALNSLLSLLILGTTHWLVLNLVCDRNPVFNHDCNLMTEQRGCKNIAFILNKL